MTLPISTVPGQQGRVGDWMPGKGLASLTGLRGIAAFAVFLSHSRWIMNDLVLFRLGGGQADRDEVLSLGAEGVSFFFVLSGFVLMWNWSSSRSVSEFYRRRVGRIWPAHVAVWLAYIAMSAVGIGALGGVLSTMGALVLVQTWIPGLGWANSVNPVAWTLSCEAFFYLCTPLLARRLAVVNGRQWRRGLAIVVLYSVGVTVLILGPRGITVSTFPVFRMSEFALGALLAVGIRRGFVTVAPTLLLTGLGVGVFFALSVLYGTVAKFGSFVPPILFALVIARCALSDVKASSRSRLASPAMTKAGELSFCFYLVHLIPLELARRFAGLELEQGPRLLVGLTAWFMAAALLAALLHFGIEEPMSRVIRRLGMNRSHRSPESVVETLHGGVPDLRTAERSGVERRPLLPPNAPPVQRLP